MAINPADLATGQVVTGFSFPVVAKYSNSGSSVSYSNGQDLARGVSIEPDLETTGDENVFYANNRSAESAQQRFKLGTLKLTVDGLLVSAEKLIMGLGSAATSQITVSSASVTVLDYGTSQQIPYVGVGAVIRSQSHGIEMFRAVVYPKVRFAQFAVKAETAGDEIDWQTTELSAQISRDDSAGENWQRVSEVLDSELAAYNAVRVMLGMEEAASLPVT